MSTSKLFVAALAVAALIACGSKSKKQPTSPQASDHAAKEKLEEPHADDDDLEDTSADHTALGEVIYFEFDSSELSNEARATLESNATWLRAGADRTLLIEGHTDEVGTSEYNLALGHRRAKAAKDFLVHLGIDEQRIKIITYGEERPASGEQALNRRSMFVATKK